jgi:ATP-dependent RNA helicase DDX46/PRP5
MSGRDVIGIAKTGSGKTLAFVLPMLRHIMDQPKLEEGEGPIAMILAPARELALQIYKEVKKFASDVGLRCVAVYGGARVADQIADLKRGAEVVVTLASVLVENPERYGKPGTFIFATSRPARCSPPPHRRRRCARPGA